MEYPYASIIMVNGIDKPVSAKARSDVMVVLRVRNDSTALGDHIKVRVFSGVPMVVYPRTNHCSNPVKSRKTCKVVKKVGVIYACVYVGLVMEYHGVKGADKVLCISVVSVLEENYKEMGSHVRDLLTFVVEGDLRWKKSIIMAQLQTVVCYLVSSLIDSSKINRELLVHESSNRDSLSGLLFENRRTIKMPKERRDRSVSIDRSWTSPYVCNTSHSKRSLSKNPLESENIKEWEEARCPVCMEHPHNAILLLCSSHEKGCRPFMCDTSYRHSNCFDQFQKASSESIETTPTPTPTSTQTPVTTLTCPLCRGQVTGWIVVEAARGFMNGKTRSCASETCEFSGTYADLRKHARLDHPLVRPSEADPDRQRDWRRLERQRDMGDLLSTLQSSIADENGENLENGVTGNGGATTALSFDEDKCHCEERERERRIFGLFFYMDMEFGDL
ncbi:unnamed protein product [Lactuca virosa]|uniref:Uncharacterized protein n=1 Tax=Lactuca virosa TaxID=75947 RepID=A0AAU9MYF5_9ASTR|nr:unnamed protein product [Lactuca virosa]